MANLDNVKSAATVQTMGILSKMNEKDAKKYQYLKFIRSKVYEIRSGKLSPRYLIECFPLNFLKKVLVGKVFYNGYDIRCTIEDVFLEENKPPLIQVKARKAVWRMYLRTAMREANFTDVKFVNSELFEYIDKNSSAKKLEAIKDEIVRLEFMYLREVDKAQDTINSLRYTDSRIPIQATREAIQRARTGLTKDVRFMATIWNSTFTKEEQEELIKWIQENIYSMHLYVIKGSALDINLTEMFPEEQYGKISRTEPSEHSVDTSISGYVSFNSDENAPLELFNKLAHKVKLNTLFKSYEKTNKFRFNSYLLVLFLLTEYNDIGFKLGVRNLNNYLKKN